jgi:putative addiction module component (TIGR02574 family)
MPISIVRILSVENELLIVASYDNQMTIAEIQKMSVREKLRLMEWLWDDLRGYVEDEPVPDSHKQVLDQRRFAVEEGREKVLEWDEVKSRLSERQS